MSYELTPEDVAEEYGHTTYGSRVKFLQSDIEAMIKEAIEKERERCSTIVVQLMDKVADYPNGSFSVDESKNRAIYNHLHSVLKKIRID